MLIVCVCVMVSGSCMQHLPAIVFFTFCVSGTSVNLVIKRLSGTEFARDCELGGAAGEHERVKGMFPELS